MGWGGLRGNRDVRVVFHVVRLLSATNPIQVLGEGAAELVATCADQVDARLVRIAVLVQHLAYKGGGGRWGVGVGPGAGEEEEGSK